jgi:hypothetical protein
MPLPKGKTPNHARRKGSNRSKKIFTGPFLRANLTNSFSGKKSILESMLKSKKGLIQ